MTALLVPIMFRLPPQTAASELKSPFEVRRKELLEGNPLAAYAELIREEKAYDADPALRDLYWQARGTAAANLGDPNEADEDWDRVFPPQESPAILRRSPLEGCRPVDAVEAIAKAARTRRWVMVGEEHLKPQTRSMLPALLRALRKQGFRTLAVETFRSGAALEETQKTGVVTYATGGYTADPVFAAGVREAVRLGYRLVPYEAEETPPAGPANDPWFRIDFRETLQARHLKERIFDRDPKAKVLVWAGRAHVLKTIDRSDGGPTFFTPMGAELRRLTGVDPLSIYEASYAEHSTRRFEHPLYRWATDQGLVRRPTVFVDANGKPYGDAFDMQVFWPRTTWSRGRPDWLRTELGRVARPVPAGLVRESGLQLAQAFAQDDPASAVPVDQILIRPGFTVPSLMLPAKGRFWIRVLDAEGRENGRVVMEP